MLCIAPAFGVNKNQNLKDGVLRFKANTVMCGYKSLTSGRWGKKIQEQRNMLKTTSCKLHRATFISNYFSTRNLGLCLLSPSLTFSITFVVFGHYCQNFTFLSQPEVAFKDQSEFQPEAGHDPS